MRRNDEIRLIATLLHSAVSSPQRRDPWFQVRVARNGIRCDDDVRMLKASKRLGGNGAEIHEIDEGVFADLVRGKDHRDGARRHQSVDQERLFREHKEFNTLEKFLREMFSETSVPPDGLFHATCNADEWDSAIVDASVSHERSQMFF